MEWSIIRSALGATAQGWLYDPNVTFIDYGYRRTAGRLRHEEEPCIRVHVREKFAPGPSLEMAIASGATSDVIPTEIGGIPVDVARGVYHPKLWSGGAGWSSDDVRAHRRAVDPLAGGVSTSDGDRPIAGTLGGIVTDRTTGHAMLLSNWHVLLGLEGWVGMPVRQPGNADGGTATDTVGAVARHAMGSNIDAAVAALSGRRVGRNEQLGIGPVRGVATAQLGMRVVKSGRTSGLTYGRVTGVEGTPRIPYGWMGERVIRHVTTVTAIDGGQVSEPGDSGSFWLDEDTHEVVGLHFAGNAPGQPEEALFIDIVPVLDALDVDLLV